MHIKIHYNSIGLIRTEFLNQKGIIERKMQMELERSNSCTKPTLTNYYFCLNREIRNGAHSTFNNNNLNKQLNPLLCVWEKEHREWNEGDIDKNETHLYISDVLNENDANRNSLFPFHNLELGLTVIYTKDEIKNYNDNLLNQMNTQWNDAINSPGLETLF